MWTRSPLVPGQLPDVIAESLDSLQSAAAEISATDGARRTPCRDWNVTRVLQHAGAGPAAEFVAVPRARPVVASRSGPPPGRS